MTQILWEQLRKLIAEQIGFTIREQDLKYFQHKINYRVKQLKLSSLKDYYYLLQKTVNNSNALDEQEVYIAQKEWKILASLITNGESFFFRDRGQFDLLTHNILPNLIKSKIKAKETGELSFLSLKIWSAGCSTGEEVYSLAMLVSELIPNPASWNIVIIGTDINQDFLNKARQGIYQQWSFRLTDPVFKTKYFLNEGQNWQVKPHLKSMVSFYQDNLVDIENITHHNYDLDLVICRNVFIYFELESIAKAVNKITRTLRTGGYLISGHAELQSVNMDAFTTISFPESVVYQYQGNQAINSHSLIAQSKALDITNLTTQAINLTQVAFTEYSDRKIKQSIFERPQNISNKQIENKTKTNNSTFSEHLIQQKLKHIQELLDNGIYLEVIQEAEKLIIQQKKSKESYYLIAQAYANQRNFQEAQENCDRALKIDSMYIAPLYLLAQIAEENNDFRKAKELLKRIIYLEPSSINAYVDLGAIYEQEKDFIRSKKMYYTAYELLKKSPPDTIVKYQNLLTHIQSHL